MRGVFGILTLYERTCEVPPMSKPLESVTMPEPDDDAERRALAAAEADVAAGRLVPDTEAKAWFDSLRKGESRSRPRPWK